MVAADGLDRRSPLIRRLPGSDQPRLAHHQVHAGAGKVGQVGGDSLALPPVGCATWPARRGAGVQFTSGTWLWTKWQGLAAPAAVDPIVEFQAFPTHGACWICVESY